ncbi:MAG: hypothetical protein EPN24_03770 [Candidatus Methanoperedens sp.]|nr:MAG: hypothetical protein EPN24_03770 [Candidatus Methanoperedens sp.]
MAVGLSSPSRVSEKAISRGISQLGTLGSGNHYLEIQVATPEKIFDKNVAKAFGIFESLSIERVQHDASDPVGKRYRKFTGK